MKDIVRATILMALGAALIGCDSGFAVKGDADRGVACSKKTRQLPGKFKNGFVVNIARAAAANEAFLRVAYTGKYVQLVLITIPPGEHLGAATSSDEDQFFRIDEGTGELLINDVRTPITSDSLIVVPAGSLYDIANTSKRPLRLHAIYSPPQFLRSGRQLSKDLPTIDPFDGCLSE